MITPNIERVILKRIDNDETSSGIILPGQLKAGENLYAGRIVHPGSTSFTHDQVVYYSEYSASAIIPVGDYLAGTKSMGESMQEQLYVVAADDIMAYEG